MTGEEAKGKPIEELREEIDGLDAEVVRLLDQRAVLAREIGRAKAKNGQQTFFDAARQKQVLEKALAKSAGKFPTEALSYVFAEIMSGCLACEEPPSVGYLGPEATFSHMAALSEFGHMARHQHYNTIPDVFHAVDRGWVNYGVVPIENSTGGVIHTTLDMFIDFDLRIVSEIYLPIHHNLISKNPLDKIEIIYSKAEPFQQCQQWLRENLPGAKLVEVSATSRGVEMARESDNAAAIASELAARQYDVPVLAAEIEDLKDNTTRFVVIGREASKPTGRDKTSIMVAILDRPGALFELLRPFHDRNINLSKIESRPTRRKAWDFVFFIDLEGHAQDPVIAEALAEVPSQSKSMKIMGSYPKAAGVRDTADIPTPPR